MCVFYYFLYVKSLTGPMNIVGKAHTVSGPKDSVNSEQTNGFSRVVVGVKTHLLPKCSGRLLVKRGHPGSADSSSPGQVQDTELSRLWIPRQF